ncbi:F-type H+-transporting ATPase subunit b [Nitratiruptor sp. YY08-26]|uniref:F0F1 ATP synthase subunit B n=1 Tax=unclassified Nitratiruptor TaxID=2624044 RepID=UPI001915C1E1|nr:MULTISPECIES: F0F1 ATP synthase subunit B [unclassified Nitratiruptor]BCD62532.1 F-type H+-transporting ATPase subunit b [Nitratiruptor sp. YY08-13]BCD66468.1 F-type H+-transporting ATPase subunit b [Nitratiruptor sp. YY08-26]
MNLKIVSLLLLGAGLAMAGEGAHHTDIVPRTVNFLIFAAILYYLIAEPVKSFFKNRSASIAMQLEEVQTKLKRAKEDKEKAQEEVIKAKELAQEILETTKKEIEIMTKELKEHAQQEIALLEKSFEENMELERRKRVRKITQEVLEELFEDKTLELDKQKFVNLIVKKVA